MTKKVILVLLLCASVLPAIEAGIFVGKTGEPSLTAYGVSFGLGFFLPVPFVKMEIEGWKMANDTHDSLSVGVMWRPKFRVFAPYVVAGAGAQFPQLNLHFSTYDFFTFLGGGLHIYARNFLSLRLDYRLLNLPGANRSRFSAGIFFHL